MPGENAVFSLECIKNWFGLDPPNPSLWERVIPAKTTDHRIELIRQGMTWRWKRLMRKNVIESSDRNVESPIQFPVAHRKIVMKSCFFSP